MDSSISYLKTISYSFPQNWNSKNESEPKGSYPKEVQGHRQPKVTELSNNWLYNDPIKTTSNG